MFTAAVEEIFKRINIEVGFNINAVRLSKRDRVGRMKLHRKKSKIVYNEVVRSRLRTGLMIDGEHLEEVTE